MKKRITSIALAIMLLYSMSIPTFAYYIETRDIPLDFSLNDGITQDLLNEIEEALSFIEFEKELYGFADVELTSLTVGSAIRVYEFIDGKMVPHVFCYYPLIVDGRTLAHAVKIYGESHVDITPAMVRETSSINAANFSLVYDRESVYSFDGNQLNLLRTFSKRIEPRDLLDVSLISDVHSLGIEVSPASEVPIINTIQAQSRSITASRSRSLVFTSVPNILQSESNLCWAACVVSIGRYYTSTTSWTDTLVAKYIHGIYSWNHGGSFAQAQDALNYFYSVSGYTIYNSVPTIGTMYDIVDSGRPIYSRWSHVYGNHDMVIRSVDSALTRIGVMDPELGGTATVTRSLTNTYFYTSVYGTLTTLHSYMG